MNDHLSGHPSPGPAAAGRSARPLDASDRQILRELITDARTSIRSLAERVHVSRASAYSRVGRLVDDGVITGFTAKIDHERAGLGTSAYVSLTIEQNSWPEVSAHLGRLPYVEHVSRLGADFDVLVLVRAPDNAALRVVVLDRIQAIPSVRSTRTWLVFDEFEGAGADWDVT
ncbi:MAG TPA: Lrp/AsnC family transcriptional regulator [Dermatophilaceae bacterium]